MTTKLRPNLSVCVDNQTHAELKAVCKQNDVTLSQVLRKMVKQYVNEHRRIA